jgi:hypothetical protein
VSDPPSIDCVPAEAELVAELAREECSERRLLARQATILLVLVALLVVHAVLS